jgi:hypothetical protein
MLTAIWNPYGFLLIDVLAKGDKFWGWSLDLSHLFSFTQNLAPYQDDRRRHFVIHTDNPRFHCAKVIAQFFDHNSWHRATHSPYSQIWPSQTSGLLRLLVFGNQKGEFQGSSIDESDELFSAIQATWRDSMWDHGCGISRMHDRIAKMYWSKYWRCWVTFKLKCSIPFSKREILRCYDSMKHAVMNDVISQSVVDEVGK